MAGKFFEEWQLPMPRNVECQPLLERPGFQPVRRISANFFLGQFLTV